ncbi:carbon-nitrogen family hydrolase [Rosettibacter firmus]|uniref:carbon-nitrogen family hydrolase n=1 Tax=Rosettibacter firmus TaxID=3111522 RepID=UPI00336BD83C
MKAGLVQFSPVWENKDESIKKIETLIDKLNEKPDLLIFPEMTLTGFTMHSNKFAEEIDGSGMKYFMKLASELKTHIFFGIIEKNDSKFYNSLIHLDRNGLITAYYRKIHPFTHTKEDKFYSAGNEIVITKIDQAKIGLSICYDLRFPELFRLYAKQKVELIINIANWPIDRIEHWKTLLKARAIENQCFIIGVNRTGNDPYFNYNGNSAVVDPSGNILVINENEEKIILCDINLDLVEEIRNKLQFLNDIKLI